MTLVVSDLGWDDLDFECYVLWSMKIQVNPTQVRDHQCHPVVSMAKEASETAGHHVAFISDKFHPRYCCEDYNNIGIRVDLSSDLGGYLSSVLHKCHGEVREGAIVLELNRRCMPPPSPSSNTS